MTNSFDLVIFDCDGVLVDSEPIANRVLCERLDAIGLRIGPAEVMSRFVGRTRDGCLTLAAELLGRPLPARFGQDWDAALFDALRREVRPVRGVEEAIRSLAIPVCAATNGTRERVCLTLESAGLMPLFDGRIFCAGDVAHPKPAPDLFLHAARTMGAAPSRCAVVEDTVTGTRAGIAAGMTVFGYAGGAHSDAGALAREGATAFDDMGRLASLIGGLR